MAVSSYLWGESMYLGPVMYRWNIYVDKSIQSGWRERPRELYECELCGKQHHLVIKPDQPFFCTCNHLVEIESPECETCQKYGSGACYALGGDGC